MAVQVLKKHYDDITEILSNQKSLDEIIDSVIAIASNKTELGLIHAPISRDEIKGQEVLFIFADFNVRSRAIANEVKRIAPLVPSKIIFMPAAHTSINYAEAKDLFSYAN